MVSCINEVTVESRRSPFTSYPSNDVSFHFRTPAGLIQRGEGRRADTPPYSSKGTNEQSSVSCELKAYLFQAPESINACIILWIQLFSPAKWLGHPCMKPISNFQSETHPGTTYRSSKSHLPLATVWRTGAVEHVVQICLCVLHTVMRTREVMRVCFILYVLFLTCFQYVAVVKELLNTGRRTNYDTNWSLHHVKGRKREVKERKEEEEAEEWRKRNEKDGREGRLCVKGQNVMSLINYSICHEKKQDEIFSPHCPFIERDTLCSKDGGKRHEDKTGLKIHQRDGQISSSGQLAGRNSFFSPQLLVSMEGSPFVCQTHAFILFCYFLYTVCTPHTRAHTLLILTWTSYIPATPVSVPVISLYACQHTYVQAEHTHRHTHSHPYEHWLYMPAHKWYKSNPHMNCFHFISSQLLPSRWLMWLLVLEEGSL